MICGAKRGVLVFDFGTSKVRAVLIDLDDGMTLVRESMDYPPMSREGELPGEKIWAAAQTVAARAVEQAGRAGNEIAAVSFSWFGANLLPMDETGEALYPILVSYDARAEAQGKELARTVPAETAAKVLRGGLNAQSIPAKILWFKQYEPDVFARAKSFGSIQQYILGKLGFPAVWDRTMAATSQYYDVKQDCWMPDLARATGLERLDGRVCESTEILGEIGTFGSVTLPRKVPLVIGGHDCVIAQLGQGVSPYGNGLLADMAGTYDLMGFYRRGFLNAEGADCITAPGRENFSVMAGNPSGAVLTRFMGRFFGRAGDPDLGDLFERAVFDGTRGLRLTRAALEAGQWPGDAAREDLFAALVETVTLEQRTCFRNLAAVHGGPFSAMRIGGGGARSEQWLQLKADLFGLPVERCRNPESSCVGVAMLAGIKIGAYENCSQAAEAMCVIDRVFEPREEISARYAAW
ncbi:MAG: L-fuculokinase [Oscillospiraceae bacterium]